MAGELGVVADLGQPGRAAEDADREFRAPKGIVEPAHAGSHIECGVKSSNLFNRRHS